MCDQWPDPPARLNLWTLIIFLQLLIKIQAVLLPIVPIKTELWMKMDHYMHLEILLSCVQKSWLEVNLNFRNCSFHSGQRGYSLEAISLLAFSQGWGRTWIPLCTAIVASRQWQHPRVMNWADLMTGIPALIQYRAAGMLLLTRPNLIRARPLYKHCKFNLSKWRHTGITDIQVSETCWPCHSQTARAWFACYN